jgi:hypothetical protein
VTGPARPPWCDLTRCTVADGTGLHQSGFTVVTTGRKRVPRIILLLVSPPAGQPVRMRLVLETDVIVASAEIDLDTGALLGRQIERLVDSTRPAE